MRILHLSDIHFRKSEVETAQDPNYHLRSELLRDIGIQRERLGSSPDLILISGDVAFGGDPEEYTFATNWIRELCEVAKAEMSSVFVIPGNHDVARKVADSAVVQALHDKIKSSKDSTLDRTISSLLLDEEAARLLYQSVSAYNAFALQFLCDLLPPNRTRARRDLLMNDGSTLRVWGINTAFVSSSADIERQLFVDTASLQMTREPGVINLVAAHHHLSWLRQQQAFEDHLDAVAPIQVFGHIHTNRVVPARDWMRFTASAANPDRVEANWEPGYNWIELLVENIEGQRKLAIRADIRVWQTAPSGFRAKMDGAKDVFLHSIELEPWLPPIKQPRETRQESQNTNEPDQATMTKLRDIGVRFYGLTFSQKSAIAGRLGLLEEDDLTQPDFERFRRVFLRAHERGQLSELENAIKDILGDDL